MKSRVFDAMLVVTLSLIVTAGVCYAALVFGRWIWT
jgi:hypothetical protein